MRRKLAQLGVGFILGTVVACAADVAAEGDPRATFPALNVAVKDSAIGSTPIDRFIDTELGVVCYVHTNGLSCIPYPSAKEKRR